MSKARLQDATDSYDHCMQLAIADLNNGNLIGAISNAKTAWTYLPDMMRFGQRFEKRTFDSVPCIDLVLKHAPLVLDVVSLDELSELLRSEKSIDRIASDDLAARLKDARSLLHDCYTLWKNIEDSPDGATRDTLAATGVTQARIRDILDTWTCYGLIRQVGDAPLSRFVFVTLMSGRVLARCMDCGALLTAPKRSFLDPLPCPKCSSQAGYLVLADEAGFPVQRSVNPC